MELRGIRFGKYSKKGYDSNTIEIMDDEADFEKEQDGGPDITEKENEEVDYSDLEDDLLIQDEGDADDEVADIDDNLD